MLGARLDLRRRKRARQLRLQRLILGTKLRTLVRRRVEREVRPQHCDVDEHDAERAVRAGLGIVEATPKLVTSDRRKTFRAGRRQRKRLPTRDPPPFPFRDARLT